MIGFLRRPAGRWTVRIVGLVIGWVLATQVFDMAWDGDGHAFLVAMLLIVVVGSAYAVDQLAALALSFAPAGAAADKPRFAGPIPPLSPARQAKVRRLHQVMAQAGVFAPEVPDPALAFAAFAVDRQPVDWVGVLQALAEAPYYHPDLADESWLASWNANLLFDHVPAAWLTPPAGKVAAVLWEDDGVFLSLVEAGSMAALAQPMGRSATWAKLTDEVLAELAKAGIAVRQAAISSTSA